ncbi:MAG: hypothetical protein JXB10_09770 [Pirellulales bacterium]|nr:hypothetical protein [Pirellulales bacterium]
MQFHVVPAERLTEQQARQAYLTGLDGVGWPVRASYDRATLVLRRTVADSACLHLPWFVPDHGPLMLSTGILMETAEPYLLPLELARGLVNQLRTQLFEWQAIGLQASEETLQKTAEATQQLAAASVQQFDPSLSALHAEAALHEALQAIEQLAAAYVDQAFAIRAKSGGKLASFLGADLGDSPLPDAVARRFLKSFNAANVPLTWRAVETAEGHFDFTVPDAQIAWCRRNGLKVIAGPLPVLDAPALPDWLTLFEDDFDSLLEFVAGYVRAVVARYRGQVDLWRCAGRVNSSEVLGLSEEEKFRLVLRVIETIKDVDPRGFVALCVDQPWAEYMSRRNVDFPPLHFADALLRTGAELSGLVLEINVGYSPGGTSSRHLAEFSRMIDVWSGFDLPLWIALCVPGAAGEEPLARRKIVLPPDAWSPAVQRAWTARYIPLLLVKTGVEGVLWNQLRDDVPHDFPHAGLFDLKNHPKPALRTLAAVRKKMLL